MSSAVAVYISEVLGEGTLRPLLWLYTSVRFLVRGHYVLCCGCIHQ